MNRLKRIGNWMLLFFQSFVWGFGRAFSGGFVVTSLWIGGLLFFASYLSKFIGEDRAVAFVEKHPILTVSMAVLFAVCTCGLGYWAWNSKLSDFEASFNRRQSKLRVMRAA